ncbi:unnamed protein product, partial [Callosobruchus maculatus]
RCIASDGRRNGGGGGGSGGGGVSGGAAATAPAQSTLSGTFWIRIWLLACLLAPSVRTLSEPKMSLLRFEERSPSATVPGSELHGFCDLVSTQCVFWIVRCYMFRGLRESSVNT